LDTTEPKKKERVITDERKEEINRLKEEALKKKKEEKKKEQLEKQKEKDHSKVDKDGKKKDRSILGITVTPEENFSAWYTQVITKAELIEYYDISGCYVLRPWAYAIWEFIKEYFDKHIKRSGVQNAYFPLLVSKAALETEETHLKGFSAEVAWVTRSGDTNLEVPVAIRPTSETIMYPLFAKWIDSYRDMPLRLNQWANVVRWEFKDPVPFLRSREFLWQEGHSAFSTLSEAEKEVLEILDLYAKVYEEILAVPVIKGKKSEGEKFAGGYYTTTVEAFVPTSGRGIQAATSHCLGQNFSKMFKIQFNNIKEEKEFAWQNSWGLTTRSIGIAVMVHGDKKGLVFPATIAPIQVVIITIPYKDKDNTLLEQKAESIAAELKNLDHRVHIDDRDNYSPGQKIQKWVLKGVPIRIEIGHEDYENNRVTLARRDLDEQKIKEQVPYDKIAGRIKEMYNELHHALFEKARKARDERITKIAHWDEFVSALDKGHLVLAPWCTEEPCEDIIKKKSGEKKPANETEVAPFKLSGSAKSLCIPFNQPDLAHDTICFSPQCGKKAISYGLFGRSY